MNPLSLLLLPALAFGSTAPTPSRYTTLLIPMDRSAEAPSLKLELDMDETLASDPLLTVKKPEELFGLPVDATAAEALKHSDIGYAESKAAFDDGDYDDAERKLHATLKEYAKAAAAMTDCGHYCDAIAMYAAVLHRRGEVDESRLNLLSLLSLDPTYELSPKIFAKDFITLKATVATSVNAALRENAMVKSHPAGARVFLDGKFEGYTPMTLPQVEVGQHLVRVEHPGFTRWGQIVDIRPEPQELDADLEPTPAWQTYDKLLDQVAAEVPREEDDTTISSLGKTLGVDRAIIGTLRTLRGVDQTELLVGLFEIKDGKRLAFRKVVFQGNELGQLKEEVGHVVHELVNAAGNGRRAKASRSSDPLDHENGMDTWSDDDHSRGSGQSKKKQSGDPLNSVDGMDDW
ncbi:PEGA domain-containing protein [Rhodanobacter sp. T12-5]|uniref:PEGA domain-containing protein n=1 Tax=Rhodanobacter sp. T12-5 TaxID=2024611 RepID=UPI0011EF1EC3|nr:PEGA domain-containing protein [Rhodanobacter sp. T12-5]KAA0070723.1 PEGA domain-containing protein [Rhodanobacter sp. T12-5]